MSGRARSTTVVGSTDAESTVVVNGRFVTQPFTGVQRYALELCRRMPVGTLLSPGRPATEYADVAARVRVVRPRLRGHLWEQAGLPSTVPRSAILWSPSGAGPLATGRQVVTIHDTAHLEHPEWYDRAFSAWYRMLLPLLARRVARIITVSDYSKERLVAVLRIDPERIDVVPLAAGAQFARLEPADVASRLGALGVDGPYVLAVGAHLARKNFARLYEAWERVVPTLGGVRLVVVGKAGLAFSNLRGRERSPTQATFLEHVSDHDLACLYNGALAFVFPSLDEGFGLPVLEAMACGTPVITSSVSALPEVADSAAILVDPLEVDEIAGALARLVQDDTLRAELRAAGLRRAQAFNWDRSAQATWAILRRTVEA